MTSFATDIAPMFAPFRGPMTWRVDLTNHTDVCFHAPLILTMIQTLPGIPPQMPPPPFVPLTGQQVNLFKQWQSEGCPA